MNQELFNRLKGLYYNLQQVEWEESAIGMVMESGGLTEEEAAQLSEGPTLGQLVHAKARIIEEIAALLDKPYEVLNSGDEVSEVGSEEGSTPT